MDNSKKQYNGDYKDIAEILQGEFGITNAEDSKPVLATYGLGPCVAISGYSKENKIGFLTHCDLPSEESINKVLNCISKVLNGKQSEFEIRLVGGEALANLLMDILESKLSKRTDIKMRLIEKDTGMTGVKDIALDTRGGRVYSYNSAINPYSRGITLELYSILQLAYCTKKD